MPRKKQETFGERLRNARDAKGLSLVETGYQIRPHVPERLWQRGFSYGTIDRLERGLISEEEANPLLIGALAIVLDIPLDELSPVAAADAASIVRLVTWDETDSVWGNRYPGELAECGA